MDRKDHIISALIQQRDDALTKCANLFADAQEQIAQRDARIAELENATPSSKRDDGMS